MKLTARELPTNPAITSDMLYDMCMESQVPLENWPNFIATHYLQPNSSS